LVPSPSQRFNEQDPVKSSPLHLTPICHVLVGGGGGYVNYETWGLIWFLDL
jgi:hypothetical protein